MMIVMMIELMMVIMMMMILMIIESTIIHRDSEEGQKQLLRMKDKQESQEGTKEAEETTETLLG